MSWADLKLSQSVLSDIDKLGFDAPTSVQEAAIPHFLNYKDVVVEAVTGSGKSLAFIIPIIEILSKVKLKKHQIGALIVTPTRELAVQLFEVLQAFTSCHTVGLYIGGNSLESDLERFKEKGANILVGSPGRVSDLLKSDLASTKEFEVLVLDEADRLLDMGFEKVLKEIISRLPKQRRTSLFSATMTDGLNELVKAGLRNPVKIVVKIKDQVDQRIPSNLDVYYDISKAEHKLEKLVQFLSSKTEKSIVYFCTCACVDYFHKSLLSVGVFYSRLFSLHGKMEHKKRTKIYEKYVQSKDGILFCTDLAARGLDIPDVEWVIQMDAPQDPSAFVHRIGRTGRSGKEGKALVFLLENEFPYIEFLRLRKIPMEKVLLENPETGLLEKIKKICACNREIFEKGTQAFVSYLRSYQEHRAKFIFQIKDLDLPSVMQSFSLLKVPKMPELKLQKIDYAEYPIDTNLIPYLDEAREKSRQKGLLEKKPELTRRPKPVPWSQQKARKTRKIIKKTKVRKREYDSEMQDDWNELRREEKLKKKLSQGKITKEDFENQQEQ